VLPGGGLARERVASAFASSGRVVVIGERGVGKTYALGGVESPARGGGLRALTSRPGLPISRAIVEWLPVEPRPAAAFVADRLGAHPLVLDDLQWSDDLTLAVLAELPASTRVVAAVRLGDPGTCAALDVLRASGFAEIELSADPAATLDAVARGGPELALAYAELLVWPFWAPERAAPVLASLPTSERADAVRAAIALQSCDPAWEANADGNLRAIGFALQGDERARAVAESAGLVRVLLELHLAADCDRAVFELREYLRRTAAPDRDVAAAHLALALADLGRTGEALGVLDTAERRLHASPVGAALLLWARGEAEFVAGRYRRAAAAAAGAIERSPGTFPAGALAMLTLDWVAAETSRALPDVQVDSSLLPAARAEHVAIEMLATGAYDAAEAAFVETATAWEHSHRRASVRCAWAAGEAARRAGDRERAVAQLEGAAASAERLGLRPLVARVRASLRELGVRRGARRGPTTTGLTPRERQALLLVGEGLTSREIGQRLGIAPSTVDTQVESAVRRLGARSRRQAAAMLAETVDA